MSVSPKEKKQLQENWDKAEAGSSVDIPDGTYQVKVVSARFHETSNGKYQMKIKYKIVGGDEEYNGKEFELAENLETAQNMGFFKDKLKRLNIAPPEDFSEVMDGTVADQLEGKVFEGQVKSKNNFLNVYVNRLVAEGKADEEGEPEEKEEKEAGGSEIEEGAAVTWGNGKKGEVLEVLADDQQARVKKEDGTTVRVALNLLSVVEEEQEEEEEEEAEDDGKKSAKSKKGKEDEEEEAEEDEDSGAFEIPEPDAVEDMSAKEVKDALKELGFDASDLKNARAVLHGFCTLAHDPKAKIQLDEIAPLADALEVELGKKDDFKTKMKALSEAVQEKIG